jgi:hypothetical protein
MENNQTSSEQETRIDYEQIPQNEHNTNQTQHNTSSQHILEPNNDLNFDFIDTENNTHQNNDNNNSDSDINSEEQLDEMNEVDEIGPINIQRLFNRGNNNNVDDILVTIDRSKHCYVCDESKIDFFFNCGNGVCSECLSEHFKAQLEKYKVKVFSDKILFVCAGPCKCPLELECVLKIMTKPTKALYDDILFKMYLSKTKDIISCPVSSCTNYGFYNKNNCPCYECNICGYKWEENKTDIIYKLVEYLKDFKLVNIKSLIKKYMITKYCNKCNSPIEKAEGCKHIECNRCDYSFCWRCMDDWSKHNEFSCMGLFTNIYDEYFRPEFTGILLFYMMIVFVLKFLFSFKWIPLVLIFLLKLALFVAGIGLNSLAMIGCMRYCLKYRNKIKGMCLIIPIILGEFIVHRFNLHPFSEKLYYYSDFLVVASVFMAGYKNGLFYR